MDDQTHKESQRTITSEAAQASLPALSLHKVADDRHAFDNGIGDQQPPVETDAFEEQQPLPRQRRRKPDKRKRINVDQYAPEASSSR